MFVLIFDVLKLLPEDNSNSNRKSEWLFLTLPCALGGAVGALHPLLTSLNPIQWQHMLWLNNRIFII